MSSAALDGAANSVDDVVDVSVIAPGCAVAEHRHWLILINQPGEFGDCQIGSIARAKGGKEAKSCDRQAMNVMVCFANSSHAFFVAAYGLTGRSTGSVSSERSCRAVAIDA